MSQSYQNLASDQICKVQNDKKLISFHDRLRAALPGSYAQIHAKGEFSENNHKVHSLIGVSIQDYSNGTGERNIITRFHLSPEQVQFFLTRLTAGFQEFEWSISKIFGEPDQYGYSTATAVFHFQARSGIRRQGNEEPVADPDCQRKGDQSTESKRWLPICSPAASRWTKLPSFSLRTWISTCCLKRVDAYVTEWEHCIAPPLITNGKEMLANQQAQRQQMQRQPYPYAA